MNLPKVITDLVEAQNNMDSLAYSNCFSETAIVFDEGKNHTGKPAIKDWIEKANQAYQAVMKPLEYIGNQGQMQVLKAEVSGNFPGSPLVLTYQMELKDGYIESLKIS